MTLFRRNNDVIALCVRWDRTTLPLRPRLHYIKHTVHWLYCSGCWFHLGSAYLHIIKHTVHWLYSSGCWFHLGSAYLHILYMMEQSALRTWMWCSCGFESHARLVVGSCLLFCSMHEQVTLAWPTMRLPNCGPGIGSVLTYDDMCLDVMVGCADMGDIKIIT